MSRFCSFCKSWGNFAKDDKTWQKFFKKNQVLTEIDKINQKPRPKLTNFGDKSKF